MPAKDIYHDAVKNALIKEGWTITADPYPIKYDDIKLFADLKGEKIIAADKADQRIVVEVKSFLGKSPMREFETALGQYLIYRAFLSVTFPDLSLYLAIGQKIYREFFQKKAIQFILRQYNILLIVVDLNKEEVTQWIK